jgi:hypothetical protein
VKHRTSSPTPGSPMTTNDTDATIERIRRIAVEIATQRNEARAEIERLRAAMDGVARLSDDPVDWEIYRTHMGSIARAALGPSKS